VSASPLPRAVRVLACLLVLAAVLCACGTDSSARSASPPSASPPAAAPSTSPPSASPSPDDRQVITLTYAGGKAGGDTGRVRVRLGTTVLLRVTSDVADEVHVHGVDEYVDLVPGRQVEREFVADTPGVFEVELHDAGTLLTRLQVQ